MNALERFVAAGPDRRRWLENALDTYVAQPLNYYLGPTGIPERLGVVGNALEMTDAGDMVAAADASRNVWNNPTIGNAAELAAAGTALALPFYGARLGEGIGDLAGELVEAHDPSRVNIFAGRRARTADMDALQRAESMARNGADRDEIWRETGWFQGVDGEWRFEIDDAGSQFKPEASRSPDIPLDDGFSHLALRRAYPDAFEPTGIVMDYQDRPRASGAYRPDDDIITVNAPSSADMAEPRSVMLHELQHAVQNREGFGRGGSQGDAISDLLAIQNETLRDLSRRIAIRENELGLSGYRQQTNDLELKSLREQYDALVGRAPSDDDVFQRYQSYSGEVEARNVQNRLAMPPAERRATPPWATQDVPDDQQIVRRR